MPPASTGHMMVKVAALTACALLFTFCFSTEMWECYIVYAALVRVPGIIHTIIFILLCGLALVNVALVLKRDPGKVPAWLSIERVDAFVIQELQRLAATGRSAGADAAPANGEDYEPANAFADGAPASAMSRQSVAVPAYPASADAGRISFLEDSDHDNNDDADVEGVAAPALSHRTTAARAVVRGRRVSASDLARANDVLTQAQQVRSAYDDAADHAAEEEDDDDIINLEREDAPTNGLGREPAGAGACGPQSFPLDHPDRMEERRRRKRRHGMRVRTAADVAYDALCRIQAEQPLDGHDEDSENNASRRGGPLVAMREQPATKDEQMSVLLCGAGRCRFCRCYKLEETHHCSRCNRCVHRMDHHCDWLATCIGVNNQKFFLLFLSYLSLACVTTTLITLYLFYKGLNYLVADTEIKMRFFICFTFVAAFAFVLPSFTIQSFYDIGRGESTLKSMRREERRLIEQMARRTIESATYQPLFREEQDEEPDRFLWSRLRVVFGEGSVFPGWFLPTEPLWVSESEREAAFWADVREMIERQIYSIADSTGEGVAAASVAAHSSANTRQPAYTSAVAVHDTMHDALNVKIDLIEDDFHVSAPAAATTHVRDGVVGPPHASTPTSSTPQNLAVGRIVNGPRSSSSTNAAPTQNSRNSHED